ncbi:Vitamin B12 transporter BtuB [Tepidimonas thermarum]|uniref:Vitamin B12 transporter BtuB n=2 Tax=Tepidimonas thermarum TaxID=335431 RepID=A0A554WXV7_9BURK|nr:Vitamin B12 transporter BtuB [Tepidimonas thermarum]
MAIGERRAHAARVYPLIVGGWLGVSVSALAQPVQMDPVVVTATRVTTPLTELVADVSIIDRAQLEQAGLQSLIDVLANLPGVQVTFNGSYRSNSGVFLRGASSSQTILLINGVRVGSATTGSYSLESLPLDRIERVEVLRGAAAALYGPDAVGGVIQVFTREPQDGLTRSASVGAGTDGQRKLGASLQGQSGDWGYSLGASHERAKGINVKLPGASGFNADADGFEYSSLDASVRYRVNARHLVSAQVLLSDGEYGFDGAPFPNPLSLNAATARAVAYPRLEQQVLKWSADWTAEWTSTLTYGHSRDVSVNRYWRIADGAAAGQSRFNTTRSQLIWQNDVRLGRDTLSVIAEQRKDEVDSTTNYTVSSRTLRGLAASYAMNGQDWNGLVTARHDRNSQFGSFNTWALSAGYKLSPSLRLVGSTGTTFQAPSFNQLYFPGFGNPDLTPQKGRAHELGLRYQQGSTRASAVLYRNRVQGFITPSTNVQSNQAVLEGVTLTWDQSWGATALSVSYDHADPRLKPSNDRVLRVARHVLRTQVSHRQGAWQSYAELRLSSDREDAQFPGRVTLPGYGVLNVGAAYQIRPNLTVQVRLNNLTDKAYSLANGYTMPGRNLFVSLNWND